MRALRSKRDWVYEGGRRFPFGYVFEDYRSILFGGSGSGFRRLDDMCTLSSFPGLTGPYLCAWGGFLSTSAVAVQ